ncbi:MAG: S-methyl-5'-thioadenosine phosphorylase [Limnochordia bacterium]|jgi:5'-methylthioadenosine phosphorylase|nr:S-methyl-5'-thioadenosine phosphorylase [Bacillota bacterium]
MLAVIGGTGLYDPGFLAGAKEQVIKTPYGEAYVLMGEGPRGPVAFMARHGRSHGIPPHLVNYRANIWALDSIGATGILATAAVGSLRRELAPGSFLLLDQFIDFTKTRISTFAEDKVIHVDFTRPYCPRLGGYLVDAARRLGIELEEQGCYVCTEGPRYETPAEVKMFAQLGGDVVGMTNVPEVVLARELGICYATVAVVTNYGAGIAPVPLSHDEVGSVMKSNAERLRRLLQLTLELVPPEEGRCCGKGDG